jgi:hypothetical protein
MVQQPPGAAGAPVGVRELSRKQGGRPQNLVHTLAFEDLAEAAALSHPPWQETAGADGYVSVEVPPGSWPASASTRRCCSPTPRCSKP